jgi:putative ABC transport system permease protein
LAKIIIEKNAQSISMSKILGYQKREINQIYIHTTTFVTILSLLIALPLVHLLINWIWHEMMTQYTGWIPCVVLPSIYGKVILIGVATYAVVAALLMRQTNKIPLADALKNVE